MNGRLLMAAAALMMNSILLTWSTAAEPIKVFILAGQSNMQGHASITTFDSLGFDPVTAPLLKDMRGVDGKPKVCQQVWISSIGCLGDAYSDLTEKTGLLTAGFGAPDNKIGPEFTFGIQVEKSLGQPILLIKTAWGGRSLHVDFRPPGAGPIVFNDFTVGQMKTRGSDPVKECAEANKKAGIFYRHMISHVKMVLGDIKRVVPAYQDSQGFELSGFVWFQGFNDMIDSWTYHEGYENYSHLLSHLIRDVRKDLSSPSLPVVIGVMGIDGLGADAKMQAFRKAMAAPAGLPEFQRTVIAVETAPFWVDNVEELKKQQGVSNEAYHYLGAARIIAPIGKAFADAAVKLVRDRVSALTGPGPYLKLASLCKQIQAGQNLGAAFKTLKEKQSGTDPAEVAEASAMLAAFSAGAQSLLDEALRMKEEDPISAIPKLDLLAKKFAKTEFGEQAKQASDELKRNPAVKREIQAEALWGQISALEGGLKQVPNADVKSDAYRRVNGQLLQKIVGNAQSLAKRFPDTQAAKKAASIIERYR